MEYMSLDESAFVKEHPWCMVPQWDEAKRQPTLCGKQGVAVVSTKGVITEWDEENWRTVCQEHYDELHKPLRL